MRTLSWTTSEAKELLVEALLVLVLENDVPGVDVEEVDVEPIDVVAFPLGLVVVLLVAST